MYACVLPVFIFTTSVLPFLVTAWHRPLKRALASKGYEVTGEFACRRLESWGPLWLTGGLVPADRHSKGFWTGFGTLIATFIAICWRKVEPPKWPWG